MSDSPPANPLTEQTIQRLKRLAEGNGVDPNAITLMQGEEKFYDIEGVMNLVPLCDVVNTQYTGAPAGKTDKLLPDAASLQAEIGRRKQEFQQRPDWIEDVKQELHSAPGEGWGLDGAKVALSGRTAILAASIPCPQCHGNRFMTCGMCQGRKFVTCIQCRGQRQEFCYNCHGSGINPLQQNQPCPICQGRRYMTCRMCRGTGQTPCPTCGGRGGTACTTCKGSGQTTEEAHLTFGATTHFQIKSSDLPGGLRRGLDRLGIANLAKGGHADIRTVTPKIQKDEDDFAPPEEDPKQPGRKPPDPTIHYVAHMPFAELRMDFAGKKAIIGAFGKRGALIDVPPFLDGALEPWRAKLASAAQGRETIGNAAKARAIHDALALELQGKGNAREFRRFYPVGLSTNVADEIILNTRKAVKRTTLLIRAVAATLWGLISAAIFFGCYFTPLPMQFARTVRFGALTLDVLPPVIASGIGCLALSEVIRFVLQKNFPGMQIARGQKTGKTGIAMIVGIIIIWAALLVLSPARPPWLHLPIY